MIVKSGISAAFASGNADMRLTPIGHHVGLISDERYEALLDKKSMIEKEIERVNHVTIGGSKEVQEFLETHKSTPLKTAVSLAELIRRPELSYEILEPLDKERKPLPAGVIEQVNIHVKYEGYITRQLRQVEQFKKMEVKLIPEALDYNDISGLRIEAQQKLSGSSSSFCRPGFAYFRGNTGRIYPYC